MVKRLVLERECERIGFEHGRFDSGPRKVFAGKVELLRLDVDTDETEVWEFLPEYREYGAHAAADFEQARPRPKLGTVGNQLVAPVLRLFHEPLLLGGSVAVNVVGHSSREGDARCSSSRWSSCVIASTRSGRPWNAAGVFWDRTTCQRRPTRAATSVWCAFVSGGSSPTLRATMWWATSALSSEAMRSCFTWTPPPNSWRCPPPRTTPRTHRHSGCSSRRGLLRKGDGCPVLHGPACSAPHSPGARIGPPKGGWSVLRWGVTMPAPRNRRPTSTPPAAAFCAAVPTWKAGRHKDDKPHVNSIPADACRLRCANRRGPEGPLLISHVPVACLVGELDLRKLALRVLLDDVEDPADDGFGVRAEREANPAAGLAVEAEPP